MKAIVTTRYGAAEGLQLQEVERPQPGENELLIRVHAATVTAGDVMLRRLPFLVWAPLRMFMGLKRKKIPGHEFSGVVEAVGNAVTRFHKGDEVFGTTTGLSVGANAEYLCLPESWKGGVLAHKPANVTHAEAATLPVGGMTALYLLTQGNIGRGQKVLVYGASGSVGSYAVQLAVHFGADVTGVASTRNVALVKSLGARRVIDYTQEDFTGSGETYDLIFDAVGKISPSRSKTMLKETGAFVSIRSTTHETRENLLFLKDRVEAGAIRPVIDSVYPLAQTAEAHRYVESGRKRGNVVIAVVDEGGSLPQ
jgi:NADPH:quinone reductase-like Zn-dependent oxidoreductase